MSTYLQQCTLLGPQVRGLPSPRLGLVVVIPVCNAPYLSMTLDRLYKVEMPPSIDVEILLVLHHNESATAAIRQQNQQTYQDIQGWILKHHRSDLRTHFVWMADVPDFYNSRSYATKIGLDEACWRYFKKSKSHVVLPLLAWLDQEAKVDVHFFTSIVDAFANKPLPAAAAINVSFPEEGFRHDVSVYRATQTYKKALRHAYESQLKFGFQPAPISDATFVFTAAKYMEIGGWNLQAEQDRVWFQSSLASKPPLKTLTTTTVHLSIPDAILKGKIQEHPLLAYLPKGSDGTHGLSDEGWKTLCQWRHDLQKSWQSDALSSDAAEALYDWWNAQNNKPWAKDRTFEAWWHSKGFASLALWWAKSHGWTMLNESKQP